MRKVENFVRYFINKMTKTEAEFASAYLGFYILLSIIPIIVFASNVIVNVFPNFHQVVFDLVDGLPNDVQNIIEPVLDSIFNGVSSSLSIISIVSAMWLGSRGFLGLMKALNKIFQVSSKPKFPFQDKVFSVLFTIAFIIVLGSMLLFSVFNEKIVGIISSFPLDIAIIDSIRSVFLSGLAFAMPLIIQALLLAFFYRFAPSFNKETRPRYLSVFLGALVGAGGISVMTFFYKFTNDTLQRSPSIYGSLGSVLVTLVWLLAICNFMIYGAIFVKTFDDIIFKKKTIFDIEPETKLFFK